MRLFHKLSFVGVLFGIFQVAYAACPNSTYIQKYPDAQVALTEHKPPFTLLHISFQNIRYNEKDSMYTAQAHKVLYQACKKYGGVLILRTESKLPSSFSRFHDIVSIPEKNAKEFLKLAYQDLARFNKELLLDIVPVSSELKVRWVFSALFKKPLSFEKVVKAQDLLGLINQPPKGVITQLARINELTPMDQRNYEQLIKSKTLRMKLELFTEGKYTEPAFQKVIL